MTQKASRNFWDQNARAIEEATAAPNQRIANIAWAKANYFRQVAILLELGEIKQETLDKLSFVREYIQDKKALQYHDEIVQLVQSIDNTGLRPGT